MKRSVFPYEDVTEATANLPMVEIVDIDDDPCAEEDKNRIVFSGDLSNFVNLGELLLDIGQDWNNSNEYCLENGPAFTAGVTKNSCEVHFRFPTHQDWNQFY